MLKEKKCEICGKSFISNSDRSLYCSEPCRQKGKIVKREERKEREEEKKRTVKDKRTINQINEAALAENLSYGQYVAKYHLY